MNNDCFWLSYTKNIVFVFFFGLYFIQDQDLQKTVDESARIERLYSHLFDLTIVNTNIDESFHKLMQSIDLLSSQRQWVPVDWVYDSPIMPGPTHVWLSHSYSII